MPAQQRLQADHSAGSEVDLRLIKQFEFPAFDGMAHAVFEIDPLVRTEIQRRREKLDIVAAVFLGGVHGGVRVGNQRLRILTILWKRADADARGNLNTVFAELKIIDHGIENFLRDGHRRIDLA